MLLAYTRRVSPTLAHCELTHLARDPIDVGRAEAEHAAYEALLAQLGIEIQHLPATPELPDAVFVEDAAIVLDEVAVITRPGARSRRSETATVEAALSRHRPILRITEPATLDGGDVLVTSGRRIHVGLSSRTTRSAADQLAALLAPFDYEVIPVAFQGCLHLKTAVTQVADGLLLLNPEWVDPRAFPQQRSVSVHPSEPAAANALALPGGVIHPSVHARTRERLAAEGLRVLPLEMTELAKAEAGVTCCSLILRNG